MQTNRPQPKYYLCSLTTAAARNLVNYYNRVLEPLGLTAQQVIALGILWQEDNISLGVFARRAGVGKPAAAAMIKRLETMGWVDRRPHPVDGRLNTIVLTDQAREKAPMVLEQAQKLQEAVEEALGEDGLHKLIESLTTIRDLQL
jgi:DNA-binding MarR family transcriptional regulator